MNIKKLNENLQTLPSLKAQWIFVLDQQSNKFIGELREFIFYFPLPTLFSSKVLSFICTYFCQT